jgi:hypothetical protein
MVTEIRPGWGGRWRTSQYVLRDRSRHATVNHDEANAAMAAI